MTTTISTEFRSVIQELIATFGVACQYEDSTGRRIRGTGAFESKRVRDEAGAYVYQETNNFYLLLPAAKTTTVVPGEFVTVGTRDYVVTTVVAYTLDDRGFLVFNLELQR